MPPTFLSHDLLMHRAAAGQMSIALLHAKKPFAALEHNVHGNCWSAAASRHHEDNPLSRVVSIRQLPSAATPRDPRPRASGAFCVGSFLVH